VVLRRPGDRNERRHPQLAHIPRLLFSEPSPAPLKYCLWRAGLIASPELRLPMLPVTSQLAAELDGLISRGKSETSARRPAPEPVC
jgi:4-hydroxy-tetrahydrodipicolinate synthase